MATQTAVPAYLADVAFETYTNGKIRATIVASAYSGDLDLIVERLHAGGTHGVWLGVGVHEVGAPAGGFSTIEAAREGAAAAIDSTPQR